MSTKSPSLNALRVFTIAAQAHSFKAAAQQLGVSQSAITRQIQNLEEQLGTRLFQRDNRVHALTPSGLVLAPELQRIFRELDRVVDRSRTVGDDELTTLRIAVPESFLRWWLASRLPDFYSVYPHIRLYFSTHSLFPDTHERADIATQLQHETLDLAIHYGKLREKSVRQTPLYQPTYVPICLQPIDEIHAHQQAWLIDPESPYWRAFTETHVETAKQLTTIPVSNSNIAIDLLTGNSQLTLLDRLFLSHPSLRDASQLASQQVQLPQPVIASIRSRQRQPVALVAFIKWLEARIQRA